MVHFTTRARMASLGVLAAGLGLVMATGFGPSDPASQNGAAVLTDLWDVPPLSSSDGTPALAEAVSLLDQDRPADALQLLQEVSVHPDVSGYVRLYEGRALTALERHGDAVRAADALLASGPGGYLREAALWLKVEAAEAAERWPDAIAGLEALDAGSPIASTRPDVLLRLAKAAEAGADPARARASYARLHFDFPASSQAAEATKSLARLGVSVAPTAADWSRTFDRAERLFSGRQYTDARKAFVAVRPLASADVVSKVDLRLAECDFHLRRYATARDALRPLAASGDVDIAREARYYQLGTLRALGRDTDYFGLVESFVADYPDHRLAETALNDLGTHFILADEDGKAAEVFRDMYARYPTGAFAGRAAWKAGWWSYRSGDYAETIRLFESAAVGLRRADYRPSWLYWAARAHAQLGNRDAAAAAYRQTIYDYRNSYYGRIAARELERLLAAGRPDGAGPVSPASRVLPPTVDPGPPPANAPLVARLLEAGLFEAAAMELRLAQRESGSSPRIEATLAYALNRQGQLRPAITAMRRAYPQFMAAGGEALPRDILTVIFPVDHWDLIRQQAAAHKLDPYLMTALIAQESTFQADVRSSANAWGLMQIIPGTGRRYASKLGIRPFTTWRLTDPQVNVRIGMTYFSELLAEFGDAAPALAAYNAGESRVRRWLADRPGIGRDEFIDDIPFPETQNYVKRILGTAEDYRLLYGGVSAIAAPSQD